MNSVLIFPENKKGNDSYQVTRAEWVNHIITHLKKKIGDPLQVTLVGFGIFESIITEIDPLTVKIIKQNKSAPIDHEIHIYVGMGRPQSIKKILEIGTTLGVTQFTFFKADLSDKSYFQSPLLDHFQPLLELGLMQSAYYHKLPQVKFVNYNPFLKELPEGENYILSLKGNWPHTTEFNNSKVRNLNLFIGPERGWTSSEENQLIQLGAKPILISNTILRMETALIQIMAQIEYLKCAQ